MQEVKIFDAGDTGDCLSDELIRLTVRGSIVELVVPIEFKANSKKERVVKAAIILKKPTF